MGRFFNTVISPMHKIPTGKTGRKDSLEELRIKFNKEQNGETVCGEATKQEGTVVADAGEQGDAESVVSIGQDGLKRTGRPHKGTTRKTRSDKGIRRPSGG